MTLSIYVCPVCGYASKDEPRHKHDAQTWANPAPKVQVRVIPDEVKPQ